MNKPVIIEPEAEDDVRHAYDWYELQRPGLGDDFALCVEAALSAIAQRPRAFPKVHKNARRVLIHRFPYLVVFVEQKDVIIVVAVVHGARHPKTWKRRIR
jgi:plasmid stabilization system protein ParE